MDENLLCVVSTTVDDRYVVHALDISDLSDNFSGPVHPLPCPLISLPIAARVSLIPAVYREGYPSNMSFGSIGSRLYMVGGHTYLQSKPLEGLEPSSGIRGPIRGSIPSLDVFIFNIALHVAGSSESLTKGPSLMSHKGDNPIVIAIGKKLFVLPKSLGPNATASIEVLDTEEQGSSWTTIKLPPVLVEMADLPFTVSVHGKNIRAVRKQCPEYDPFKVEAYGTKGSQLLLSLSLCGKLKCSALAFDVQTQQWRIPSLKTPTPFELVYPPLSLYSGSICFAANADTSYVHFTDIKMNFKCCNPIPSPLPILGNMVVKYGEKRLVSFSWSVESKYKWEKEVGTYFRVDVLVRFCHRDWPSMKDIQTARFVTSKVYQLMDPQLKLWKVNFCYLSQEGGN